METFVRNERFAAFGGIEKFSKLQMQFGAFAKKDSILLSQSSWCDDKRNQRVLVWGKHELFHLMKHKKLDAHVDATFKCTPKEFYQTLIFSVRDHGTKMHVPIFFVLMTCKTEEAYDTAFFLIEQALGECHS